MLVTNKLNLPKSFVEAVLKDDYDINKLDKETISVTSLINPPKIRLLSIRHHEKLEEDILDRVWSFFGKIGHKVMENIDTANRFIEERVSTKIGDVTLTGKPDLYEIDENTIYDVKVTSVWTFVYNPLGRKEWIEQLNCYSYLYHLNGIGVKSLKIIGILKDWNKREAKLKKDYPQNPIHIVELPLWKIEETKKFVEERLALHLSEDKKDDDAILVCTPEERWAKNDSFAVYKNSNKTASRVTSTEEEAKDWIIINGNTKDKYRIEFRKGEDLRCKDYCSACDFCNYYKKTYGGSNGN